MARERQRAWHRKVIHVVVPLNIEEKTGLSSFLADFSLDMPKLDAMRQGIELYGATRFSPFAIFSPDENTLSRVIAELFDPKGSHGQGLLFVNALLQELGYARLGPRDAVRVRREAMTRRKRRIDIVIESRNYVIGIENKPWAGQQANQLADYFEELSADLMGREPILIFLSSQEARTAKDDVHRLPYFAAPEEASLYNLLVAVLGDIRADPPRRFVEDFNRYIKTKFGDHTMDDEADRPYTEAVSAEFDNIARRKAIAAILLSQFPLHTRILNEVGDYIYKEMAEKSGLEWEVTENGGLGDSIAVQYGPWGLRRPNWPVNCYVAIEAQGSWCDKLTIGVKAPDSSKIAPHEQEYASPARPSLQNLVTSIPGGRKTHWWPWCQWMPDGTWGSEFAARLILESPTGAVDANPHIQDLARQFVELGLAVVKILDGKTSTGD